MPFVNPLVVTIQLSEVDFFFWPCISGEKYPPVFSGGTPGVYGSYGVNPAVVVNGTTGGGVVTWPNVPAYGGRYSAWPGLTVSFIVAWDWSGIAGNKWKYSDGYISITVNLPTSSTADVTWTVQGSGSTVSGLALGAGSSHTFSLAVAASGAYALAVDGVTIGTGSRPAPTSVLLPVFRAADAANPISNASLSKLRLAWPS